MSARFLIGLVIILLFYLLICVLPYLFERVIIFQDTHLDQNYRFDFPFDFEEHFVKMNDAHQINAILIKSKNPSNKLIIYTHGNADNLQRWGNYAPDLIDRGYDILMYDYRGYGKSEGDPSIEGIYADANEIYDWSQSTFSYPTPLLYGRSLGSAVASHVATNRPCEMLILETPFNDLNSVMRLRFPWMIQLMKFKNNFSNQANLNHEINYPVHIIHGDKDKIVPLSSAQKLKPLLKAGDSFTVIKNGKHKNLGSFEAFQNRIEELLGPQSSH